MRTKIFFYVLFAMVTPVMGFESAYLKMDLPEGWRCQLNKGVWQCSGKNVRQGVLLSIAVMAAPGDSLNSLEKHLRHERLTVGANGAHSFSQVTGVKRWEADKVEWVGATVRDAYGAGWTSLQRATVIRQGQVAPLVVVVTYVLPSDSESSLREAVDRSLNTLRPQSGYRGLAFVPGRAESKTEPSVFDFIESYLAKNNVLRVEPSK